MFDYANRAVSTQPIKHEQLSGVHVIKFRTETRLTPGSFMERCQSEVMHDGMMARGKYRGPQGVVLGKPVLDWKTKR